MARIIAKLKFTFVTFLPEDIASLEEFIFGDAADIERFRWEMLVWSLSLNGVQQVDVEKFPHYFLTTILALVFLVQVLKLLTFSDSVC